MENIGNTTLKFLEIWNTGEHSRGHPPACNFSPRCARIDKFEDISLSQWLALTPPSLVEAHLQLPQELLNNLNKTKQFVVGPASGSV